MTPIFILAWALSLAFTMLVAAGVVTYIRRTWQVIRSHSDETAEERLLDGLDQIQTQLYRVTERLGEIEGRLAALDAPGAAGLPRGHGDAEEGGDEGVDDPR